MGAARWRSIRTSTSPSSRRGSRPRWTESAIEAILYLLWDLGLKVGHQHAQRRRGDPRRRRRPYDPHRDPRIALRLGRRGALRRGRGALLEGGRRRLGRRLRQGEARRARGAAPRMGDSRYVVEPNVKEGKGGLRDLHALFWIGKYAYRLREVDELVEVGLLSADGAAPVPARRALPVGGALPPPPDRRPRRGAADLRLSARDRGADELCRPAGQIAGRALHAPLFPAREDGRRPDRRLPRPSRREVRRAAGGGSAFPPSGAARASSKASCSTAAGSPSPTTISWSPDPVRLIRMFALADRYGLEIHPLAMRAAGRNAKLIDAAVRADPEANRLFLDVLTSPRDPETVLRWMNEAGVFGRFIPDFGRVVAQMQFDMYHHYTVDEHSIRAIGLLSQDRARPAEGGSSARHRARSGRSPRAGRSTSRCCSTTSPRGAAATTANWAPRSRSRSARGSASPTPRPRRSPGWCAGIC